MSTLARCTHRWKAENVRKALAGFVTHELLDYDGREVRVPFEPRVEYDENFEPTPWIVR